MLKLQLSYTSHLHTSIIAFAFLVCTAPGVRAQEATARPFPRAVVHAATLTLEDMTEAADRIVVGDVTSVERTEVSLERDDKSIRLPVQLVTLALTQKIKGQFTEDQKELEFKQLETLAQPIKKGETLMLYLSADSPLGLTAPLGVYSGHFKIIADESADGQLVAWNLRRNEGLWEPNEPLFAHEKQSWQTAFHKIVENTVEDANTRERVMMAASRPSSSNPVPLELLTSATKAFLADGSEGEE